MPARPAHGHGGHQTCLGHEPLHLAPSGPEALWGRQLVSHLSFLTLLPEHEEVSCTACTGVGARSVAGWVALGGSCGPQPCLGPYLQLSPGQALSASLLLSPSTRAGSMSCCCRSSPGLALSSPWSVWPSVSPPSAFCEAYRPTATPSTRTCASISSLRSCSSWLG